MPHPLQNRVTPFGEIVAVTDRGTMMGNRGGCIHDGKQKLGRRRWASRRWICCLLRFKGWQREVMTPGRYTELFFLDEATAFAAGHRPCAECRRADYKAFQAAWQRADLPAEVKADAMDVVLHAERTGTRRQTVVARDMPDGVLLARGEAAYLVKGGRLFRWSFQGYGAASDDGAALSLLTPPALVKIFAAGFRPGIHPSCD
ncbi:MAG: hypothetical protein HN333_11700 [Rhodospirillaceae bacterium]|nr:hypothetical protein [Rhodospirillaceae bacterium]